MSKKNSPKRHTPAPKTVARPAAAAPVRVEIPTPAVVPAVIETPQIVEAVAVVATPVVAEMPVAAETPFAATTPAPEPAVPAPTELIAVLRGPSAEAAVDAAAALAKTADPRCVDALLETLANADGYYHVVTRAAAAMALGQFDEARVVAALTAATDDAMAEVSREAVLALGTLNAVAAIPAMMTIARNVDGYYAAVVRHAAVRTLGKLRASAAQPLLATIALCPTEDAALVAAARDALGRM